jgi:hypothetical protein
MTEHTDPAIVINGGQQEYQMFASRNLLREAPRFFDSWTRALHELFQNAYRAGATSVNVVTAVNAAGSRYAEITDNGCGIRSPNSIFILGEGDWGDEVVEPAGMGFYGCFREGVASVHVASNSEFANFEVELTHAQLDGEPATVQFYPLNSAGTTGTVVTITFEEDLPNELGRRSRWEDFGRNTVRRARALYPMEVGYNGSVVDPIITKERDTLEVPGVGAVHFVDSRVIFGESGHYPRTWVPVWEHVPLLEGRLLEKAVGRVQYKDRDEKDPPRYPLVSALVNKMTLIEIDPDQSPVRPVLPSRTKLQESPDVELMMEKVLSTAEEYIKQNLDLYVEGLPETFCIYQPEGYGFSLSPDIDVVDLVRHQADSVPGWLRVQINTYAPHEVLQRYGWQRYSVTLPLLDQQFEYDTYGAAWGARYENVFRYFSKAPHIYTHFSDVVASVWCAKLSDAYQCDLPLVAFSYDDPDKIEVQRFGIVHVGEAAFCSSIKLLHDYQEWQLPFLVRDPETRENEIVGNDLWFLVAGDIDDLERFAANLSTLAENWYDQHSYLGDWEVVDAHGDYYLDFSQLTTELGDAIRVYRSPGKEGTLKALRALGGKVDYHLGGLINNLDRRQVAWETLLAQNETTPDAAQILEETLERLHLLARAISAAKEEIANA